MANRYTDTTIWKKQKWFKKLPPLYKLAWRYLTDECNHAGVWKIDLSELLDDLGLEDFDLLDLILMCNKDFDKKTGKGIHRQRIIQISDSHIWITGFITFQYGGKDQKIKTTNNIVKSAIEILNTFNIYELAISNGYIVYDTSKSTPTTSEHLETLQNTSEHLPSPKDKVKDKDNSIISTESNNLTNKGKSELKKINTTIHGIGEITVSIFTGCDEWQLRELIAFIDKGQKEFEQIAMTKPLLNSKDNFTTILQAFIDMIQSTGEYQTSSALKRHLGHWINKKNGSLESFLIEFKNNTGKTKKKLVI